MKTRREFLSGAARCAVLGSLAGAPATAWADVSSGKLTYGVQLYELRQIAATDLARALNVVAEAGYTQVELYPPAYKRPARELTGLLRDAGLGAVAGHFNYEDRAMSVDYARQIGLKYIVCPMMPKDQWFSVDGYLKAADHFTGWGKEAQAAGLHFAWHNEDFEFHPLDDASQGANGFEVMMKHTDPALVKLELDLYWLVEAGQDPAATLRRYANRAVLLHLKDRTANAPVGYTMDKAAQHFVDMGKGAINWPGLLQQARAQGIEYAYMDEDETSQPVAQSLRESHQYLARLGI